MTTPQVERQRVPLIADERSMLEAWLDWHRATLLMKCAGLTADQLKLRPAQPSTLSLLGLVRHMTDVERSWFRRGVAGQSKAEAGPIYYSDARPDGDFDDTDDTEPDAVFQAFRNEVEYCRRVAAGVPLDTLVGERSVRWIFMHMLEEYARHNGHADLLRERIDGATGA